MKVVVLSPATEPTYKVFNSLCQLGLPSVSGDLHCVRCHGSSVIKPVALRDQARCLAHSAQTHTPFLHRVANEPPALIELRALHALAKACANATEAPVRSHLKIVLTLTRHIN